MTLEDQGPTYGDTWRASAATEHTANVRSRAINAAWDVLTPGEMSQATVEKIVDAVLNTFNNDQEQ